MPLGRPIPHASGEKHTTGCAVYADDIEVPKGMADWNTRYNITPTDTLHMQLVLATKANAQLLRIDTAEALNVDGVVAVFTHDDLVHKVRMDFGNVL
jgi:xanthine dehydrogenase molybdopterin-binding subunit B